MEDEYRYRTRAVAFLDVLGFKDKLLEFETEAINNVFTEENGYSQKYVSRKANDFINTFKKAISQLNSEKYTYYLFSDNICITSTKETTLEDLQDLLLIIAKLYYEFAQKGYFLRGGIDYGLFIDEEMIAVGMPLAKAYELETKNAIFPRIVLSQSFTEEFQVFNINGEKEFETFYLNTLIRESCEVKFLNIFLNVFESDYRVDREVFFSRFSKVITDNLDRYKLNEGIYMKYKWLADEFNEFIEIFVTSLAFMDSAFDPEDEPGFLEFVKTQKITYGN